jgi:uncharacterized protein YndB with AHSA1/START domain
MKYEYNGPRTSVSLTHHSDASPERVFDAWLDPDIASKWLFTTKTSTSEVQIDARVGGAYTITRRRAGKEYVGIGEYLEIERPRRLVFTFTMPQYAADIDTVTVEIALDGDGCAVTLTHSDMRPGYEKSTMSGWTKMFGLLTKALAYGPRPASRTWPIVEEGASGYEED